MKLKFDSFSYKNRYINIPIKKTLPDQRKNEIKLKRILENLKVHEKN